MGMPTLLADQERLGIEILIRQILPFPNDNIMADIDQMGNNGPEQIPSHIIEQSLPKYLATGRPLALLDAKFADHHSLDRLARFAKTSPPFRHQVIVGLKAGLAKVRLLRAQSLGAQDNEKARALQVIEKMLDEEIVELTALRDGERHSSDPDTNRSKGGTSWTDKKLYQSTAQRQTGNPTSIPATTHESGHHRQPPTPAPKVQHLSLPAVPATTNRILAPDQSRSVPAAPVRDTVLQADDHAPTPSQRSAQATPTSAPDSPVQTNSVLPPTVHQEPTPEPEARRNTGPAPMTRANQNKGTGTFIL